MKNLLVFLAVGFTVILIGCNEDDSKTPTKQTSEVHGFIEAGSLTVSELEVIILTVNDTTLTKSTYTGFFGDFEVTTYKMSDNELSFAIPSELPSGQHTFSMALAKNELIFSVSKIELEGTAQELFDAEIASIQADIDLMFAESKLTTEQKDLLSGRFDAQIAEFNSLSQSEKEESIKFLNANQAILDDLSSKIGTLPTYLIENARTDGNTCEGTSEEIVTCLKNGIESTFNTINKAALLGVASIPFTGGIGPAIAAGVIIGKMYILSNLLLSVFEFDVIMKAIGLGSSNARVSNLNNYENGLPKPIAIEQSKRNILLSDNNIGIPFIVSIIDLANSIKAFLIEWNEYLNITLDFPNEKVFTSPPTNLSFISVTTNNANISAVLSGTPESPMITFSSDNTVDIDYTYQLHYNDDNFSVSSDAIGARLINTNELCNGVTITFEASMDANGTVLFYNYSGGSGGWEFSIDGSPFQSNPTFENISEGIHTLSVQDSNGCIESMELSLFKYDQCEEVNITFQVVLDQYGTVMFSNISGGSGNYEFSFDNSAYQTNPEFIGVSEGVYTLRVRDSNGCVAERVQELMLPSNNLPTNCSFSFSGTFYHNYEDGGRTTLIVDGLLENIEFVQDGPVVSSVSNSSGAMTISSFTYSISTINYNFGTSTSTWTEMQFLNDYTSNTPCTLAQGSNYNNTTIYHSALIEGSYLSNNLTLVIHAGQEAACPSGGTVFVRIPMSSMICD